MHVNKYRFLKLPIFGAIGTNNRFLPQLLLPPVFLPVVYIYIYIYICMYVCMYIYIYIYIYIWLDFQKVLAEIVQKGLILSQKALISNRRNLGLFAPKSMCFPSKDSKSKDLSF